MPISFLVPGISEPENSHGQIRRGRMKHNMLLKRFSRVTLSFSERHIHLEVKLEVGI